MRYIFLGHFKGMYLDLLRRFDIGPLDHLIPGSNSVIYVDIITHSVVRAGKIFGYESLIVV